MGGTERCRARAEKVHARWVSTGSLLPNLDDLRTALFYDQRRWRMGDEAPFSVEEWRYWHALVDGIAELVPT